MKRGNSEKIRAMGTHSEGGVKNLGGTGNGKNSMSQEKKWAWIE